MWTFCMFDLPTKTKDDKERYTRFRKHLLRNGFFMMQFSVYLKFSDTEELETATRKRVELGLPDRGVVRLYSSTDQQFNRMQSYRGVTPQPLEVPIPQLCLF
jgi:CRISPR-associated protein Cas2